jgi:hypothetical protein
MADLGAIFRKANVLRSYMSLVLPLVITLLAVLVFVPTQLMNSALKNKIRNESISKRAKTIDTLLRSAVSRQQWEYERDYQQTYADTADVVENLARHSSMRELLSYKIFPEPRDTSTLIFDEFGRRFRDGLDRLVAGVNGRDCPTEVELSRALDRGTGRNRSLRRAGGRSLSRGHQLGLPLSGEFDRSIIDVLCLDKAKSSAVYVNPEDIAGYMFWAEYTSEGSEKDIENVWYYQLGYWIIEDIFETVKVLNSDFESLLDAPVKRILSVSFTRDQREYGRRRTVQAERPSYILSEEDALTQPLTGRYCNDDIDVVHFSVWIVTGTKSVMEFIDVLCGPKMHSFRGFSGEQPEQQFRHNQITVLESTVWPVNRDDENHKLYRYGDDAVVELQLICEYVFEKSGYGEIKPKIVKDAMQVLPAAGRGGRGRREGRRGSRGGRGGRGGRSAMFDE